MDPIGNELGGYRLEAEIGRGGMGVVYRAVDSRLGRRVALKVLPPEFGDNADFRARFLRESRLAASIDHPGVIPIYEAGEADGRLYIAMRNVEGTDLGRLLRTEGRLEPGRALDLAQQLAEALDAAHARGLVHRDVKPSNVLVAQAGSREHVYLCDFGLSKNSADTSLSASGGMVGTIRYMAPEVIRGAAATASSDLYSLACVLFECLTGEPAFAGPSEPAVIYAHLEQPPPRISERRADLPRALDDVLARALAKEPGQRFASGAELVAAAAGTLGGAHVLPSRRRRRRGPPALVALVALVALGIAVAVLASGSDRPRLAAVRGNVVAIIDPGAAALKGQVAIDGSPEGVASTPGAIWVTDADRNVVTRIDQASRTIRQTIAVGHSPSAMAVEPRGVWVANREDGTLSVISPQTNAIVGTVRVGRDVDGVCAARGAIWAASPLDYTLVKVDPQTGQVAARVRVDSEPHGLACSGSALWVSSPRAGNVTEVDLASAQVIRTVQLSLGVSALTATPQGIWASNPAEGTVSKIDPQRGAVVATLPVGAGNGPADLAATRDAVYVSDELGGTITRIDPVRGRVAARFRVGHHPRGLAVVGGGLWIGVADTGARHRGGTLRLEYPFAGSWAAFDPSVTISPAAADMYSAMYDGLTAFLHQGGAAGTTVVPDLAESLPSPTDGGLTYTFRLRRGLVYSDGEPVRAGDIRFGLERALRNFPGLAPTFTAIRGAGACTPRRCDISRGVVTDDAARTVTIHLTELKPDLMEVLATPFAIALPSSVGIKAPATHPLPVTGPYRLATVNAHEVRLERNPRFHSWSAAARPDGYPDTIEARLSPHLTGSVGRVLRGQTDRIGGFGMLTPSDVVRLARRAPAQLHQTVAGNTVHIVLNTRQSPFDNRDARRAVAFALDRTALVRATGGPEVARPTCQLLPPGLLGSHPGCPFTSDGSAAGKPELGRARRLVRRSGTQGDTVTVEAPPFQLPAVNALLVRTLRSIGYKAQVHVGGDDYFDTIADPRRRYQIATIQWIAGTQSPDDLMATFTCRDFLPGTAANSNFTRYCDPAFDRLVRRATRVQALDPSSADAAWSAALDKLLNDAPAIGAYDRYWTDLVSKRLGNFEYNPALGAMLVDQAWVR